MPRPRTLIPPTILGDFHPKNLKILKNFLTSLDGGRKSEGVAEAIVRDVAKFLYFCNKKALEWRHVSSKEKIHRFASKYAINP